MSLHELARRRMHNQHLWGEPLPGSEAVVRYFGAMQSQELAVARWSIAQRAGGLAAAEVDCAIADGTIVRTHVLRPTWHFVAAADLRWLIALSAPRVHARMRPYTSQWGLPDDLLERAGRLIRGWLAGGEQLTRKEIGQRLAAEGIATDGMQLGAIMMYAELEAIVCSGAPRGKQQTYAAFDLLVPQAAPIDRDEALAELARRYFVGHGPATVKDYVWWSGLTVGDARRGIAAAGSALASEIVDGRTYWSGPERHGASPPSPRVDLVQGYDENLVAYTESKNVFRLPDGVFTIDRPNLHALLLDGRVIGHWRPTLKKSAVEVATQLYRPLDPAESAALQEAADRYGRFLGLPAHVLGG